MTADDDNVRSWRDLAGQLTPEQIARFEHAEQLCMASAHRLFAQNHRGTALADMLERRAQRGALGSAAELRRRPIVDRAAPRSLGRPGVVDDRKRIIEPMFDSWESSDEYATLHRLDRQVRVDVARIFPSKARRKDELPMWVKAFGLHLEPTMMARQIAWIRTSNGGWLAAVEMPARSGNGRSRLAMNLWLPAEVVHPANDAGESFLESDSF
jgi:hypothetical protein